MPTVAVLHVYCIALPAHCWLFIIGKKSQFYYIPADNTSSAEIMGADVLVQSERNTYIVSLNAYFVCG